jgi:hypothetical protein
MFAHAPPEAALAVAARMGGEVMTSDLSQSVSGLVLALSSVNRHDAPRGPTRIARCHVLCAIVISIVSTVLAHFLPDRTSLRSRLRL